MTHMSSIFERKTHATTQAPTLESVLERFEEIERSWREYELEMIGWHEKFRTLYARLAKRVERDHEREPDIPPLNPAALALLNRANGRAES